MINAVAVVGTIDTIMTIQNGPAWRSARVIFQVNVVNTTTIIKTTEAVAITITTMIVTMAIMGIIPMRQRQRSSCAMCPNPSPAK